MKVPSSQQEHVQIFSLPLPSKAYALPFDFVLERDPKNIFYYQHDIGNYMDQVVSFLLFDRHTNGIFQSVILVNILMLQVYLIFLCSSRFD